MGSNKIIKHIEPHFRECGFKCTWKDSDQIVFSNSDDSIRVVFDFFKNTRLERALKKQISTRLRISYALRLGPYWYPFESRALLFDDITKTDLFVVGDIELLQTCENLTKEIISKILPRIEPLTYDPLFPTEEMYSKLCSDALGMAQRFERTYGSRLRTRNEVIAFTQSFLDSKIPKEVLNRKTAFEHNIHDILSLAAYFGEKVRADCNGTWEWVSYVRNINVTTKSYVVCNSNRDFEYNPLHYIIRYWNFYGLRSGFEIEKMLVYM